MLKTDTNQRTAKIVDARAITIVCEECGEVCEQELCSTGGTEEKDMLEEEVHKGDELLESIGYSTKEYVIVKVQRVTPSGQIVLEDGRRFHPNGVPIGHARLPSTLEALTPQHLEKVRRQDHLKYLASVQWNKLSDEHLEQMVHLLKRLI